MNISNIIGIITMTVAVVSAFLTWKFTADSRIGEIDSRISRAESSIKSLENKEVSLESYYIVHGNYSVNPDICGDDFSYIGPNKAHEHGGFCVRVVFK